MIGAVRRRDWEGGGGDEQEKIDCILRFFFFFDLGDRRTGRCLRDESEEEGIARIIRITPV